MSNNSLIERLHSLHKMIAEKHPNAIDSDVESSVNWPAWTEWVNGPPWRNISQVTGDERKS